MCCKYLLLLSDLPFSTLLRYVRLSTVPSINVVHFINFFLHGLCLFCDLFKNLCLLKDNDIPPTLSSRNFILTFRFSIHLELNFVCGVRLGAKLIAILMKNTNFRAALQKLSMCPYNECVSFIGELIFILVPNYFTYGRLIILDMQLNKSSYFIVIQVCVAYS